MCQKFTYYLREPGQHTQYKDQATCWTIQGSNPSRGERYFCSADCPDWLCNTPSLLCNVCQGSCLLIKWMECDIDCLSPSSTSFKNEQSQGVPRGVQVVHMPQEAGSRRQKIGSRMNKLNCFSYFLHAYLNKGAVHANAFSLIFFSRRHSTYQSGPQQPIFTFLLMDGNSSH